MQLSKPRRVINALLAAIFALGICVPALSLAPDEAQAATYKVVDDTRTYYTDELKPTIYITGKRNPVAESATGICRIGKGEEFNPGSRDDGKVVIGFTGIGTGSYKERWQRCGYTKDGTVVDLVFEASVTVTKVDPADSTRGKLHEVEYGDSFLCCAWAYDDADTAPKVVQEVKVTAVKAGTNTPVQGTLAWRASDLDGNDESLAGNYSEAVGLKSGYEAPSVAINKAVSKADGHVDNGQNPSEGARLTISDEGGVTWFKGNHSCGTEYDASVAALLNSGAVFLSQTRGCTTGIRFASGTIRPADPAKSVADHEARKVGDTVTFNVDQKVNGDELPNGYKSFVFEDTLPAGLAYQSAEVRYIPPSGGSGTTLPASAGTLANSGQKVTYTFNTSYLDSDVASNTNPAAGMVYREGTYRLAITARATSGSNAQLSNTAKTTINDLVASTPAVPALIDTAALAITKDVAFEHEVGDVATYIITVRNTEEGSIARDVRVTDDSLPAGLEAVDGSLTANGTPAKVDVKCVKGNKVVTESRDNAATATLSGNHLSATIPYLPYGTDATYTFQVRCTEPYNTQEVFNTVKATLANPASGASSEVSATDGIWINSAQLSLDKTADKYEYRVGDIAHYTVTLTNTIPGSIAKNVRVSDSAMDERMKVDSASIVVNGIPESVTYPIDGNGVHADEQRANTYTLTPVGNGFDLYIDYLPYGHQVVVEYDAECTLDSNGVETMNRATATAINPLPGTPETVEALGHVWTNDAIFTIAKQVDEYETQVGDTVRYTVNFQNIAAYTVAKDVVMDDITLPAGLVLDPKSIEVAGIPGTVNYPISADDVEVRENSWKVEPSGNAFTLSIAYLPSNFPVTVTYSATPTEDVNGDEVVNTATVKATNTYEDGKVWDADAKIWVNTPHMELEKTVVDERTPYELGDVVTYRIKATNAQPGTVAYDVVISDEFQVDGMQLVRGSVTAFDEDGKELAAYKVEQALDSPDFTVETGEALIHAAANHGIWEDAQRTEAAAINPIAVDKQDAIYIEFQAVPSSDALAGADVVNKAKVEATNAEPAEDDAKIIVKPFDPVIEAVKSSNPAHGTTVKAGDEITYFISVKNAGEHEATGIAVFDQIPVHTTFVSVGETHSGTYAEGANGVGFLVEKLAPGEQTYCEFTVKVADDAPAGGTIENMATFAAGEEAVPSAPLPGHTNEVKHPVKGDDPVPAKAADPDDPEPEKASDPVKQASTPSASATPSGKAYGKTGVNLPLLIGFLALVAAGGVTAGVYAARTNRKAEGGDKEVPSEE